MPKAWIRLGTFEESPLAVGDGQPSSEYHPHKLSGRLANVWECHVSPDWLLLWEQNEEDLILLMIDTGTHSDVF